MQRQTTSSNGVNPPRKADYGEASSTGEETGHRTGARGGSAAPKTDKGSSGGTGGKPGASADDPRWERARLTPDKIVSAFKSLPRVIGLVWRVQPAFTLLLGVLYILQGFMPALTAFVNAALLSGVIQAIGVHGGAGSTTFVIWLVVAQFGVQGLGSLLSTVSNIVQQLLQEKMSYAVQLQVMEKANTLDLTFFEDAAFYDQLQQAQREAASRPLSMISQTFGFGRTIITFFSMLAILTHLAWWIALLALLAPIPSFFANMRYGWWGYQLMRRQSQLRREMSYYTNLLTTDTYNKEIKLFTLGGFFISLYRRLANQFYAQARGIIVPRYLASFSWGLGSLMVDGLIYLYIALQAVRGQITILELTLYTQAALSLGSSFESLLSGVSSTYENNLFVNTLFDFLAYKPRISSPANGLKPEGTGLTVEFRHVSFSYPGREAHGQALHDVSFTIHAGEAVALVGRNGAGKTTIVKLLTRLYDPDEGQILINGQDIKEYDLEALRAQVGVIFQDYVTYWLTAARNIGVGKIEAIDNREGIQVAAAKSGADG
ncbi:MAG: ATP-binding cassette domain-containing protein, partial [Ktedonobacterales bacterium]